MKIIELLNKTANGETVLFKYRDITYYYNYDFKEYISTQKYYRLGDIMEHYFLLEEIDMTNLNDEVEILEEENELHANSIEFNINNDKKDCIITLDENDLGIDKLHLDNCYFYKENGKWYVKKCDFKTIKLEEEKKIPEKINISNFPKRNNSLKKTAIKLNELIDYLKSKGDE